MTRFAYFCGHEQFQPETLVAHARTAEEAGFDMVMISEHFHPWVDDHGAAGFAFSTIGAMAAITERIELVTGVTTPLFRFHPAIVAQAAATLDRLSGGRFTLGVGTGENINEGPLGYAFPAYAERAARMEEAIKIMRRLLDGERLDLAGTYYPTRAARLYSPPLHRVPIWMACGGPKSARLAGELADGIIVSVKAVDAALTQVVEPVQAAAQRVGRPPPTIVATRWAILANSDAEAWEALLAWRGLRAPGRLEATDPAQLRKAADALPRSEVLSRYTRATEPAQLIDIYRPLVDGVKADVVTFQVTSLDQVATIRRIGEEVLPVLRAIADGRAQA